MLTSENFLRLLLEILTAAESPSWDNLWKNTTTEESSGNTTTLADKFLHFLICHLLRDTAGQVISEETCQWGPDDSLEDSEIWRASRSYLLDPWDGTGNRRKLVDGKQGALCAYGILLSEMSSGRIVSSTIVGRYYQRYYACSIKGDQLDSLTGNQEIAKVCSVEIGTLFNNKIVIPHSKKKCGNLCKPFLDAGERYLTDMNHFCSQSSGCAFGNVFGVIEGNYGAYANTGHGFIYDYVPLIHLFEFLGGHVVDLESEDGIFRPTHAQRPIIFLHPHLPEEKKREFLGIYLPDKKVDEIMESITSW